MSDNKKEPLVRRLTFTYSDGEIELVSSQQVEITLPAKPPSRKRAAKRPEFWYELRDAQADVVYRLDAPDPIPTDVEVFSDDPKRTIERSPNPPKEGVFTVLMPEIEDAEEILLMRVATSRGLKTGADAAVEVARFKLMKD